MESEDFIIFSDSKIEDIQYLPKYFKKSLKAYSQNQKDFHQNSNDYISFIISKKNATKEQCNDFIETLFFYLHKGKITNFFSNPNVFCKEDFKYIILELYGDKSNGQFIAKKKFKFQIKNQFSDFVIRPIGCENVSNPELKKYNFIYRDIEVNINEFLNFWNDVKSQENTLRAINFYNKAMSCELLDDERFVWLSSSLESYFAIGQDNDKSTKIKEGVCSLVSGKTFHVLNKSEAIKRLSNLLTVIYDYRSSYVHGGGRTTDSKELERQLKNHFGKIDFVVALMNLVSILLANKQIQDDRFESIMNVVFYNQEVFNEILIIFKDSADKAKEYMKNNQSAVTITIMRFLITDLQSIEFQSNQVNKCMDNILHMLAKFSKDNTNNADAIKIQEKIDTIKINDSGKYKKWNDFFIAENNFTNSPTEIYDSICVFKKIFELLKYETIIY